MSPSPLHAWGFRGRVDTLSSDQTNCPYDALLAGVCCPTSAYALRSICGVYAKLSRCALGMLLALIRERKRFYAIKKAPPGAICVTRAPLDLAEMLRDNTCERPHMAEIPREDM